MKRDSDNEKLVFCIILTGILFIIEKFGLIVGLSGSIYVLLLLFYLLQIKTLDRFRRVLIGLALFAVPCLALALKGETHVLLQVGYVILLLTVMLILLSIIVVMLYKCLPTFWDFVHDVKINKSYDLEYVVIATLPDIRKHRDQILSLFQRKKKHEAK